MSKNIGRNIYQKMSNTIRNLKKENEDLKNKLNDFVENFDETIRKKYDVEANKKIIHLEVEKLELKQQLDEKTEENIDLKKKMCELQDLNQELLNSITSKNINDNYM